MSVVASYVDGARVVNRCIIMCEIFVICHLEFFLLFFSFSDIICLSLYAPMWVKKSYFCALQEVFSSIICHQKSYQTSACHAPIEACAQFMGVQMRLSQSC